MLGGSSGKLIVALEPEGAAATGELVEAMKVEGIEGVVGIDWLGDGEGAALWGAAGGGDWGDCGRWEAEAVADVEDKLGVGE